MKNNARQALLRQTWRFIGELSFRCGYALIMYVLVSIFDYFNFGHQREYVVSVVSKTCLQCRFCFETSRDTYACNVQACADRIQIQSVTRNVIHASASWQGLTLQGLNYFYPYIAGWQGYEHFKFCLLLVALCYVCMSIYIPCLLHHARCQFYNLMFACYAAFMISLPNIWWLYGCYHMLSIETYDSELIIMNTL